MAIMGNSQGNWLTQIPNTYATLPDFNRYLANLNINSKEYLIQEVGQTGTLNFGGFLDTDEWVGDLKSYTLYQTIDHMRTDAVIGAIERGFTQPVEQAKIHFGYDDPAAVKDTHYKFILDFIKEDFSRINQQSFLHNALMMKPYGFSAFEEVYDEKKDIFLHIGRLAPRMAKTAFKWIIDGHGNLKWLIQLVYTPSSDGSTGSWEYKDIPANKLLLITNQKEGGNFSGRSSYRPFYREWKVKDTAMKQLAITINRVGAGIPIAIIDKDAPEESSTVVNGNTVNNLSAQRQIEKAFQKMQGGENAYLVGKWVNKLEMFGMDPKSITGIMETIRYCDENIVKASYQPHLNLGTSSTGSRALGETFENMYYESLLGDAETICSAVNEQLIKRIIDMNFGEQAAYPKMKIKLKPDMSAIALTLKNLKMAGLIEGNRDLENVVLKFYGLPETNAENNYQPMVQNKKEASSAVDTQDNTKPQSNTPENGQPDDTQMSEAKKHTHVHAKKPLKLAEIGLNRAPNSRENKIINLAETADELNGITKNFSRELRQFIQPLMIEAARHLGNGAKIYQVKANFGNRVADLYRKYYKQIKEKGQADVRGELQKQNKGLHMSEIELAAKQNPKKPKKNYDQYTTAQADINSVILENQVDQAIAEYYGAAISQGKTGKEISDYMIDAIIAEVGQRYESAAAKVTGVYSLAREISASELIAVVSSKIRSEVFDKDICENCADEDGREYFKADDGEYYDDAGEIAPDLSEGQLSDDDEVHCIGGRYGNPCRGLYLYSTGEAQ